jgi:hypothetical protein
LPDLWIENNHAWVTTAGTWEITRSSGKTQRITAAGAPRPRILTNPWTVWFPDARGAPPHVDLPALISLSEHPTQGVRHFSGTASYTCRFDATAPPSGDRLFLDLGRVANLAEITLNDRPLGVHWKPPFILDITAALRPGSNTLTIAVTNTWRNRLIGDIALPDHQRTTWRWNPENHTLAPIDTLDPSGLLGPVVIRTARGIILDPPTRKE